MQNFIGFEHTLIIIQNLKYFTKDATFEKGINRLLIDSRIQGIWHGHTKTDRDRLRTGRSGGGGGHAPPDQGHQRAVAVSALGGRSNDSMGGPSTPM